MAALAIIPYTIFAQGIYTGLISIISGVTTNACGMVKSIYTHKNPDVSRVLREMDIERRLKLIQSVLNNIEHTPEYPVSKIKLNDMEKTQIFEMVGAQSDLDSDPIELCLFYLHDSMQEIHNSLTAINQKVENHNKKWFSSWRTLNIKPLLDNLKLNSMLLNDRFNDLTKISTFMANKNGSK